MRLCLQGFFGWISITETSVSSPLSKTQPNHPARRQSSSPSSTALERCFGSIRSALTRPESAEVPLPSALQQKRLQQDHLRGVPCPHVWILLLAPKQPHHPPTSAAEVSRAFPQVAFLQWWSSPCCWAGSKAPTEVLPRRSKIIILMVELM